MCKIVLQKRLLRSGGASCRLLVLRPGSLRAAGGWGTLGVPSMLAGEAIGLLAALSRDDTNVRRMLGSPADGAFVHGLL